MENHLEKRKHSVFDSHHVWWNFSISWNVLTWAWFKALISLQFLSTHLPFPAFYTESNKGAQRPDQVQTTAAVAFCPQKVSLWKTDPQHPRLGCRLLIQTTARVTGLLCKNDPWALRSAKWTPNLWFFPFVVATTLRGLTVNPWPGSTASLSWCGKEAAFLPKFHKHQGCDIPSFSVHDGYFPATFLEKAVTLGSTGHLREEVTNMNSNGMHPSRSSLNHQAFQESLTFSP